MGKIRGKKLTVEQSKTLKRYNKDINVTDYLYYGEEVLNNDGSKCASKNASKQKYMRFINRNNGDILKVPF